MGLRAFLAGGENACTEPTIIAHCYVKGESCEYLTGWAKPHKIAEN
jgi:hypothetical protein